MSDKTAFQPGDIIFGVKATGSDGLSFASQYTDGQRIDYAGSIGQDIEVKAAGAAAGQCAAGIHFSLRAIDCCRAMRGSGPRPWRFFEVAVAVEDIVWPAVAEIGSVDKLRARRITVARELSHEEALGFDLKARTEQCRDIAGSWKEIPWLKPARPVTDEEVRTLVMLWRERIELWRAPGSAPLPGGLRIVRGREEARAAAADAAHAAAARFAREYDFSEDGQTFNRAQRVNNLRTISSDLRKRQGGQSVPLTLGGTIPARTT